MFVFQYLLSVWTYSCDWEIDVILHSLVPSVILYQIFSCLSRKCHRKVNLVWLSLIVEVMTVRKIQYLFQHPKGKIIPSLYIADLFYGKFQLLLLSTVFTNTQQFIIQQMRGNGKATKKKVTKTLNNMKKLIRCVTCPLFSPKNSHMRLLSPRPQK